MYPSHSGLRKRLKIRSKTCRKPVCFCGKFAGNGRKIRVFEHELRGYIIYKSDSYAIQGLLGGKAEIGQGIANKKKY